MAKRIGVVLSGCGVLDGSEIHESVLTLLAIDRHGAKAICMAPNIPQRQVINHLIGQESLDESRNVLVEAARIARGDIQDVAKVKASDLDALIFPGGFGAAKNLCDYAFTGADCTVNEDVARLAREIHSAGKPIGVACIAPVLAAKIWGDEHPELTIGNDKNTAKDMETMGAKHIACPVREFVIDRQHKIVSTPAYMLAERISEAAAGIDKLVASVLEIA